MRFHIIVNTGERFWTSANDSKSAAVDAVFSEIESIDSDFWDLRIYEKGKLIYIVEGFAIEDLQGTLYNMLNVERILEDD